MAVDKLIKAGDDDLDKKDYLGAISSFTSALKENPKAFQAYIKRATAYQKLNNMGSAKSDISQAFAIAEERGKRSDIGLSYFRLGLVHYAEKNLDLAHLNFSKALQYDYKDPTVELWKNKTEFEIKKTNPEANFHKEVSTAQINKETEKTSTNIDVINKHAPLKEKIRDDWYQSKEAVIITLYAKGVDRNSIDIRINPKSVFISFPSSSSGSEYNYTLDPLFAEIDPEKSGHTVFSTKIEVKLAKKDQNKWLTLEGTEVSQSDLPDHSASNNAYPTSSKKSINWSTFKVDDDEKESEKETDFFEKLYKDVDEDTKRAMMKSYVESNGTVLTTNWDEAKGKSFETSPPEGMVAKKWN